MKKLILISVLGLSLGGLSFANSVDKNELMIKNNRKFFNYELRDKPFQEGLFYKF